MIPTAFDSFQKILFTVGIQAMKAMLCNLIWALRSTVFDTHYKVTTHGTLHAARPEPAPRPGG